MSIDLYNTLHSLYFKQNKQKMKKVKYVMIFLNQKMALK